MRNINICFLLGVLIVIAVLNAANNETVSPRESQEIRNLRVFAKLYGYVKYFHPSDEASSIDWDKFAVYGVEKVKGAKNSKELMTALEELFLSICTAQHY